MKKILILIFLFYYTNLTAQVEVLEAEKDFVIGKVGSGGSFLASLSYKIAEGDTLYTFIYRDCSYDYLTSLESINFNEEGGSLDKLYTIIMSVFTKENKKNKDLKISLKLGNEILLIKPFRSLGITQVFISPKIGYVLLTENQVKKLFNKRD